MILLLAGTGEARALARALAERGIAATASLAGAVRAPASLDLPTRIGGFGGAEGFATWLDRHGVTAVIDATHPFAARITPRTHAICAARGMPCLRLERPGWQAGPGDDWRRVPDMAAAARAVPADARAFLATGRQSLADFAGHPAVTYLRVIDPPAVPYPGHGDWVVGRPPFGVAQEMSLFNTLQVDVVVAKDAGGTENRAKLDAARALGLPVVIVDRPPPVPGLPVVDSVAQALAWVAAL
jgi:precorrin-6A/cobalt-precorrin-6A reductase